MVGAVKGLRFQLQPPLLHEVVEVGGVVLHRNLEPEVAVVPRQGVETVRAGGDHPLDAVPLHLPDVFLRQGLVQVLVAELPGWLAAALLLLAEDADPDARRVADLHEGPGDLLVSPVEGGVAADEIKDVDLGAALHDGDVEPGGPGGALRVGEPEGVAVHLQVPCRAAHLVAGEAPLHEGEVPAHLYDLVDMLDVCRAYLLAGPAGGAVPENLFGDGPAEVPLRVLPRQLADLQHHLHGGKRLLRGPCRAAVLAALADGAGVGVVDVLPGEVLHLCRAELLRAFVLEVDGLDAPLGPEIGEEVVCRGGEDVAQLGERYGGDEAHGEEEVRPPEHLVGQRELSQVPPLERAGKKEPPGRQARKLGVHPHLGGRHPQPFGREAGQEDGEQEQMRQVIVAYGRETRGLHEEAAHQEPPQHEERHYAGSIEHHRVDLVKGPLEKDHVEQGRGEVGLQHDQERADEQEAEAPEEHGVQRPRIRHPQHLPLAEHPLHQEPDPLREAIEPVERLPLPVNGQPRPEAPGTDPHGEEGKKVHEPYHPMTDVPVDLACRFHKSSFSVQVILRFKGLQQPLTRPAAVLSRRARAFPIPSRPGRRCAGAAGEGDGEKYIR